MWQNIKDHFHLGYVYAALFGAVAATVEQAWYWTAFDIVAAVALWLLYWAGWRRRRAADRYWDAIRKAVILDPTGGGYEPVETPTDD